MIKIPLLVYTHSDYEDVCKILFAQIEKYLPNQRVIVACNQKIDIIPNNYEFIEYDDSKIYTDRLMEILSHFKNETILFQHEDMILYNQVNKELLNKYGEYVESDIVDSIKMNYIRGIDKVSEFDNTLIANEYSKFSIQPTIIKTNTLINLIQQNEPLNIWEFEKRVPMIGTNYIAKIGGEAKRGLLHYDSMIYPYVATAIVKGKWNMNEYTKELDTMFKEYGINPFERGIV